MKLKQGKTLFLITAAVPLVMLVVGAGLQTMAVAHLQKMTKAMRQQIVFIQAARLAQLLSEAGSGMGGYSMTHMNVYADRFNRANEGIPKALEELGNLGPFEGDEAEAVSQLKQATSESMALLEKAESAMTNPAAAMQSRQEFFTMFRNMRILGERIQSAVNRLAPEGGTSTFLQRQREMVEENNRLRMLTVIWFINSLLFTGLLVFLLKQSGAFKSGW